MYVYDRIRTMQQLALSAGRGFVFHVDGAVRIDRAERFAEKITTLYHANGSRPEQLAQRRRGEARSRLFMLPSPREPGVLDWWLVASDGSGPIAKHERLVDARDKGTRIHLQQFELVRMSRAGDGVAWTWRVRPDELAAISEWAVAVARSFEAEQVLGVLESWPGFHGIRAQRALIYQDMQRHNPSLAIPSVQPWPRMLPLAGHRTSLSAVVRKSLDVR